MNPTASDLSRLGYDLSGARGEVFGGYSYMVDFFEVFTGSLTAGFGTEHWALQAWTREGIPVWVKLNATGSTIVDPSIYRQHTTHHLDMDAVPLELQETIDDLYDLRELPPGWNGYDVAAPWPTAIRAAVPWVNTFYGEALAETGQWITPHVTADETGEVMFEWSNGAKALTAYVSEGEVTLARDWGPNIDTEMESAQDPQTDLRREWWAWLVG